MNTTKQNWRSPDIIRPAGFAATVVSNDGVHFTLSCLGSAIGYHCTPICEIVYYSGTNT